MQQTSKYRVYICIPLEVTALDDIDAEHEARAIAPDFIDPRGGGQPLSDQQAKNWFNKNLVVLSSNTEIKEKGKWRRV